MSAHPDVEELEQVAKGEGTATAGAHVATCADCANEVAWAKAERALFARRAQPDVSALWARVEERIADAAPPAAAAPAVVVARRRPHWHRPAAALAALAATAAVLLVTVRVRHRPPQGPQPMAQKTQAPQGQPASAQLAQAKRSRLDPKTLAALDTAETDYRHAAAVLEAEYETLRPRLDPTLAKRWDETLTRARTQLVESRAAVAADDVRSRMRVLDGYAEYLRSLRDVIQDSEEATP
jgi:hypothetical protein